MTERPLGPVLEWPIEQGENPTCNGSCAKGWTLNKRSNLWCCAGCFKPSAGNLRYCEWCDFVWLAGPMKVPHPPTPPRNLMHPICKNEFEGIG